MITQGLEEKQAKFESRYDMVILAADRAKQIQQGSAPLVKTLSHHPLTIALEEIAAGVYPVVAKEAPSNLDEDFITGALADQDLTDIHSRFEPATAAVAASDVPLEADSDEAETEEG